MKRYAMVTWPEHWKGKFVQVVNEPATDVFNTVFVDSGEPHVFHADNLKFAGEVSK